MHEIDLAGDIAFVEDGVIGIQRVELDPAEDPAAIGDRDALQYNADGSLDLYIQHESPGADKESNWLPAPAGKFVLMLRMYWPNEKGPSIINGSWTIPPVKKVASS